MTTNPLDVASGGAAGPMRDLVNRLTKLEQTLGETRSQMVTAVRMPNQPPAHKHVKADITDLTDPPPDPRGHRERRFTGPLTLGAGGWIELSWPNNAGTTGTAVGMSGNGLQANVSGTYIASVMVYFGGGGASAGRDLRLLADGFSAGVASQDTAGAVTLSVNRTMGLSAGSVVTVEARQASGTDLLLYGEIGAGPYCSFSLALIKEL